MAGAIPTLLKYKVLSFFGPSFRGRFGPGPYILLIMLFAFYGFLIGFGIGAALKTYTGDFVINLLGAVFAGIVSFGFIFSLGPGTAAHVSEKDFIMTAPVRPREWLVADMLFQFVSILLAGGVAGFLAALGIVVSLGISIASVLALLLLVGAYVLMVLMTVQILVILRIRFPKAHIKIITVVLLVLSLIPSISLVSSSFPLAFSSLPIPQSGFAELAFDILYGRALSAVHLMYAFGWFAAIAALWYALSGTYVFHGIQPTVTAGFGQVDLSSKMAQQRRMTSALGGLTTNISLRTDTGSDLGFMTRFHMIRVWRDGSILFVLLLIFISIVPSFFAGGAGQAQATNQGTTQIISVPVAVLALYWSYYERENLWMVITSGKSVVNYFRGMTLAFAILVMVVGGAATVLLQYATGVGLRVEDLALPIISPIASSLVAVSMLTRVKIQPAAFSPMVLVVLFMTILPGIGAGYGMQVLLSASPDSLGEVVKAAELIVAAVLIGAGGTALVGRLAKGFRF